MEINFLRPVSLLEHDQVFLGPGGTDHSQVGVAVGESRAVLGRFQVGKDNYPLVQPLVAVNRHDVDGEAVQGIADVAPFELVVVQVG